jgi:hypothetical protein
MSESKKRSRSEIEADLTETKEVKHRAQKRARKLKKELAAIDLAEFKARSIQVSIKR